MSKVTKGTWFVDDQFRKPKICTTISKDPIAEIKQVFVEEERLDGKYNIGQSHNSMMANATLMGDSKVLLKNLKTLHVCYAKGIKPSVGTLKEIEALIKKHS